MPEPLFPIKSQRPSPGDAILVIEPYCHEGAWVFDEPRVGLHREPFVAGVTEIIDLLVAALPDAASGFRLLFAAAPFEGIQAVLTWVRADSVEGNWYRAEDQGDEGWLCPALLWFFPEPPARIYVRAEARRSAAELDGEGRARGPAPREIGGLPVLWFSPIDRRHRPTGKCRHVSPEGPVGPARGLAICGCAGEAVYLHRCDDDWVPFTDTWHETAEEARRQAEFEYEGVSATWQQHD